MDIQKILEYQKVDSELFKIEKSLRENANKKLATDMSASAKQAQLASFNLENKAAALLKEIDIIKNQFNLQNDKMKEVLSKNVDNLSKEEVDSLLVLKDKLSQNLNILDKNLTKLAENVNSVLAEFNKTIKNYNLAKDKYAQSKAAYDKDIEAVEPVRKQLVSKLASLEKGIDAKTMESYKKRRQDNRFPVYVPLQGNNCGYCHMELPTAEIINLKNSGIHSCEHCRRIIYLP